MHHGQISPFNSYQSDVGDLYLLIHKALNLLSQTWTQSPHWDREPTPEMLAEESACLERAEQAKRELEDVAASAYEWLVGHKPPTIEEIKAKRAKSDDYLLSENGWLIHCYSPFEIGKADGSFASNEAARMVVAYLRENNDDKE